MPAHISDSKQGRTAPEWAAMLPLLLLVCALVIPHLGGNAFTGDEPASLHNAGYFSAEAQTLARTWSVIAERDPRQSLGWPLLLTAWSRLVGWSELAIRALPLYAGLLTFALVWRIGRDAFSWKTGLAASLFLAGSAFFLTYMAVARAFSQAAFFATLLVWSYLRCTQGRAVTGACAKGRAAARLRRIALLQLVRRTAAAGAGPVSPAVSAEDTTVVATCVPGRRRSPVGPAATRHPDRRY